MIAVILRVRKSLKAMQIKQNEPLKFIVYDEHRTIIPALLSAEIMYFELKLSGSESH